VRVCLFAFGRLKTPGLRETADYYKKLVQPWATLEEIELKPLPVPDKSPATRLKIQIKESDLLLQKIEGKMSLARGAIYLLDETGKAMNTLQWSKLVEQWENQGPSEVALCVGSSLGFGEAIRKGARGTLSLGPQTFSHELARVVLLEQVYRAWGVTRGHPYHNEG